MREMNMASVRKFERYVRSILKRGGNQSDCRKGLRMVKENNAVPVMKLSETHSDAINQESDGMAVFRIWTLLTGGETMRDLTVAHRRLG